MRFTEFLEKGDSTAVSAFVTKAIEQMRQSVDRFSNAIYMTKTEIDIPKLDDYTKQYIEIISTAQPKETKDGTLQLESTDQKRLLLLTDQLMKRACAELLDTNDNLYPPLADKLNLTDAQRNDYRNKMVKGFLHYIYMAMLKTPELVNAIKELSEESLKVKYLVDNTLQNVSEDRINYYLNEHQLLKLFSKDSNVVKSALANPAFNTSLNLVDYCKYSAFASFNQMMMLIKGITETYPKQFDNESKSEDEINALIRGMLQEFNTFEEEGIQTTENKIASLETIIKNIKTSTGNNAFFKKTDSRFTEIEKELETLKNTTQIANALYITRPLTMHMP